MPHYDRHADASAEQNDLHTASPGGLDETAIDGAAEALRHVEVEAAQPEPDVPDVSTLDAVRLESMNIDALRVVAKELDIPDRATITDKDELIAAIRQRL
jgi:Rho termination factor, N-terminal domain